MTDERVEVEKKADEAVAAPLAKQAMEFAQRAWRPAGTVVSVGLALLLMIHVVNGKNGLTVWHKKRAEDKQLKQEMKQLEQENQLLREHVEHLKNDPEAIEIVAREKLHYAKPNEVIVALPPREQDQAQPAGAGK
jgi:cell division protein FtsB